MTPLKTKAANWETTGQLSAADQAKAHARAVDGIGKSSLDARRARNMRRHLINAGLHNTAPMDQPGDAFYVAIQRHKLALALDRLAPGDVIALANVADMLLEHPADKELWAIVQHDAEVFTKNVLPGLMHQVHSERAKRGAATRAARKAAA